MSSIKDYFSKFEKVGIAYSGGFDSSILLQIANSILGCKRVFALTFYSELLSPIPLIEIKKLPENLNIKHKVFFLSPLRLKYFRNNLPDRCYHCKYYLFSEIKKWCKEKNITLMEASVVDDLNDFRPGMRAVRELNIISPFIDLKLYKKDLLKIAKNSKFSMEKILPTTCYATRIPYGIKIDRFVLKKVAKAEKKILSMGFRFVRVRYYNELAKIEVLKDEISQIIKNRKKISEELKKIGFKHISVDLLGYDEKKLLLSEFSFK